MDICGIGHATESMLEGVECEGVINDIPRIMKATGTSVIGIELHR